MRKDTYDRNINTFLMHPSLIHKKTFENLDICSKV